MGELSAQTLKARGVLGYVVDGGSRDTDLVLEQGFPVFCAFLTPADIVERWIPDRFGEPVTIGDVTVATGDFLLGDRDGVVIIPRAAATEAIARTEDVMATESEMRNALISRHGSRRCVQPVRQVLKRACKRCALLHVTRGAAPGSESMKTCASRATPAPMRRSDSAE